MSATMQDAPRAKQFLLARHEGRALEWIARRLPARVLPDHLTTLGVAAAVGIAAAYLLSNGDSAWLWAACAGSSDPGTATTSTILSTRSLPP